MPSRAKSPSFRKAPKGTKSNPRAVGSRRDVLSGRAKKTSGGLTRGKLRRNRWGKIVAVDASNAARRNKNLGGWLTNRPPLPHERRR